MNIYLVRATLGLLATYKTVLF